MRAFGWPAFDSFWQSLPSAVPPLARVAISRTAIWGASAHSLLDAGRGHITGELDADGNAIPDHGGILIEGIWEATPASMPHTFLPFSSEAARYGRNGPERTAAYTGPLAVALFGDAGTGQMWAPGSAEWTTQRDTLVLYATEALAAGRAYMILATPWPPSATSTAPFFEDISAKTQLLRDEIEAAVPGIDIWVFPEHLLVQYALATYGADVYGGDGLHLRRPDELPLRYTTWGMSRMLDQFLTQQEWDATGDPAELADLTAEGWNIINAYEWCGMGGTRAVIPTFNPTTSQVYFDQDDAAIGTVTSLTTRGTMALTFTEATTTYASAEMDADGLEIFGNVLRWNGSQGPFTKFTIMADITRLGAPLAGAGVVFSINPNGVTGIRFWLRYTSTNYQLVGPNGVTINLAPIGGIGDRQVIGGELDITAGTLTAIDADGETQESAITGSAITMTRIDMAQNSQIKIHALTMIAEA